MNSSNQIPSNAIVRLLFVVMFNIINMIVGKLILILAFYQFIWNLFYAEYFILPLI